MVIASFTVGLQVMARITGLWLCLWAIPEDMNTSVVVDELTQGGSSLFTDKLKRGG